MVNSNALEGLPEIIKTIAQGPQMAEILKNAGLTKAEETPVQEQEGSGFSIPPEMLEKLPQIVSALREIGIGADIQKAAETPSPSDSEPEKTAPDMAEITARLPQVMSALSGMGAGGKGGTPSKDQKNRRALLNALKPFMNDRKRSAIDTMLSLDNMAEVMKLMMGGKNVL